MKPDLSTEEVLAATQAELANVQTLLEVVAAQRNNALNQLARIIAETTAKAEKPSP